MNGMIRYSTKNTLIKLNSNKIYPNQSLHQNQNTEFNTMKNLVVLQRQGFLNHIFPLPTCMVTKEQHKNSSKEYKNNNKEEKSVTTMVFKSHRSRHKTLATYIQVFPSQISEKLTFSTT